MTKLHLYPSPLVGIDVGKDSLYVCLVPSSPDTEPSAFPVTIIDMTDKNWWRKLINLIDVGATVTAESTGYHLLAPVAAVIAHYTDASLWQVDGKTTGGYRRIYISDAKTDKIDAAALLLIAADCAAGKPPRGVYPYEHKHEETTMRLRLLVNQHTRLTKDQTRQKGRRSVLAYSLSPSFAESETYYRALTYGAVTFDELRALCNHPDYEDGRTRRPLERLIAALPDVTPNPTTVTEIRHVSAQIAALEPQIEAVKAEIAAIIDMPPFAPVTRRWRTIKTASDVTLAALHVASRGRVLEMTIDEFKAAVGANPLTNTSGDQKKTKIARKGYKPARVLLHLWTIRLLSPTHTPNPVFDYFHGANNRSVFHARTKLARVLWGIARDASLDAAPLDPAAAPDQSVPAVAGTDTPKPTKKKRTTKRG